MKVRIKSYNGTLKPRLTVGKAYTVVSDVSGKIDLFEIRDNNNKIRYCLLKECAHLNGGDWEIVDESWFGRVVNFIKSIFQ